MKRDTVFDQIENTKEPWDFLVIGGGATGLGVAVDASARGYRTLLAGAARFCQRNFQPQHQTRARRGWLLLNRATSRLY